MSNNKIQSILLLFISLCFMNFTQVDTRHVGTWSQTENGVTNSFILQENGFATMIIEGDTFGGETFKLDGEEYSMKYGVLYTKNPYYITFTMYFKNSNIRVRSLKGIFKYDDNGNMVLCVNFNEGARPTTFIEEDTVTLTKSK